MLKLKKWFDSKVTTGYSLPPEHDEISSETEELDATNLNSGREVAVSNNQTFAVNIGLEAAPLAASRECSDDAASTAIITVEEKKSPKVESPEYLSPKSCGDLGIYDIIWAVREFLADEELFHFNRASRAYCYIYDYAKQRDVYLPLPLTQQLAIYERLHKSDKGIARVQLEGCVTRHFFNAYLKTSPFYGTPLESRMLEIAHKAILDRASLATTETTTLLSEVESQIPEDENGPDNDVHKILKFYPYHFLKQLQDNVKRDLMVICIKSGAPPIYLLMFCYVFLYFSHARNTLSHEVDIQLSLFQKDVWGDDTRYMKTIPYNRTFGQNNISWDSHFTELMHQAGFDETAINRTLLTCVTMLTQCFLSSCFEENNKQITDRIEVGCHGISCNMGLGQELVILIAFGPLLSILIAQFASMILECINRCCLQKILNNHRVSARKLEIAEQLDTVDVDYMPITTIHRDRQFCVSFFKHIAKAVHDAAEPIYQRSNSTFKLSFARERE